MVTDTVLIAAVAVLEDVIAELDAANAVVEQLESTNEFTSALERSKDARAAHEREKANVLALLQDRNIKTYAAPTAQLQRKSRKYRDITDRPALVGALIAADRYTDCLAFDTKIAIAIGLEQNLVGVAETTRESLTVVRKPQTQVEAKAIADSMAEDEDSDRQAEEQAAMDAALGIDSAQQEDLAYGEYANIEDVPF